MDEDNPALILILLVFLSFFFLDFSLEAYKRITFPYQLDYPEGYVLYFSSSLSKAENIYKDINEEPFALVLYTPFFFFLSSIFIKLFGLSFLWGRLISFSFSLLSLSIIFKFTYRKGSRFITFVLLALFISDPTLFPFLTLNRVDITALAFSLLGLFLFLKRFHYLSIPFFLLSLFTKQTFLAIPLACIIYKIISEGKKGLKFLLIFLSSIVPSLLFINYLSENRFLYHMLIANYGMALEYDPIIYLNNLLTFVRNNIFTFGIALFYSVMRIKRKRLKPLPLALLISLFVTFITGARIGAIQNHFMELAALSIIITGVFISRVRSLRRLLSLLLVIQLAVNFPLYSLTYPSTNFEELISIPYDSQYKVSKFLENFTGRIISEDIGILVINGKEPYILDLAGFTSFVTYSKLIDEGKVIKDIEDKKIPVIILENSLEDVVRLQRLTPSIAIAIAKNYYIYKYYPPYYILLPK
ncbi:MAG: hypothetical protein QXX95_01960 [Nitrososphaerales archaeon]